MADNETLETPEAPVAEEQPTPEPVDPNSPVEPLDIRLNFNAVLYILTEVVALFNRQLETLHEAGHLTDEQVQAIYAVTADKETLGRSHAAVFNRFMEYYMATKQSVVGQPEPQVVPGADIVMENALEDSEKTGVVLEDVPAETPEPEEGDPA